MYQRHLLLFVLFLAVSCACASYVFAQHVRGDDGEQIIYENWLSVQKFVHQDTTNREEPFYDRLSENFYNLYRETHNSVYLNFALHEAGRNKRGEIVESLSGNELQNIPNVIEKLIDRKINEDYYAIREFSPEDVYAFLGSAIPENLEDEAKGLLDHWLNNLPATYQESQIKGSMKAQALVHGYNKLDNFEKVVEVSRYLKESHPFPESFFIVTLFNTIIYAARIQGYYSEALAIYEHILLPVTKNLGLNDWYLRVKMDYALTLFLIGDVNAALNEFEEVYSQGIQNLDPRYQPALLNNLAISYLNSGKFDQYIQFQLEAFEIAQADENYHQQLDILRNLFVFYRRQNETELAFNYLNQALELAQENNLLSETSSILLSLGTHKRETENSPREALEHFHEALRLSEQSNEYQQQVNSYIDLAETYLILENYAHSEEHITRAVELSKSRDDTRNFIQATIRYGNILAEQDQFEEAQTIMREITSKDLEQIPFDVKVLGHNVNIKLLMHKGEFTDAMEMSSSMIGEILNWLRESTDLQTGHMRMDEEFSEAFRLHTELLYKLGKYEEAVAVNGELRNLSRTGFYNNPLLKSQILSEEELIKDYNLSNQIQDLRSRYAGANEDQKVYLGNELIHAISERNRLQSEAFPNYREGHFNATLPQVKKKLKSDQMILYFSVFKNQVFQFLISRSEIDMKVHPADDEYLELLENAVASLGHGSTNLDLLHDVYKTYFEENIPDGINHLYIIPDGIFYRLPVEILPVQPAHTKNSYGTAAYLLEDYSISYLNTLSDLITESPKSDFSYDMAGFGVSNFTAAGHPELSNLPFSPKEITNSAEKLTKFTKNRFFINEESTESNFREVAGNAKILHLATHSMVNDENPLFSSLYLFAGPLADNNGSTVATENDGIVHAYELFDLNLNANLIFLSSCESGAGGYLKGSGILGFSRAFTYAGAQSLAMNLWPIRDQSASEVSLLFYEALNEGKNKAEALRQARLSYLNNANSDPYLWGAFILYGDIESPITDNRFLVRLLVSGLLITGLFLFAVFIYQKKLFIKSRLL